MKTVVITIGRNINKAPMSGFDWQSFKRDIEESLYLVDAVVITSATAGGEWAGVCEENAVFVAFVKDNSIEQLRSFLRRDAELFQQDAVAFIVADGVDNLIHTRVTV